jgi:serine/threonine protein kinase
VGHRDLPGARTRAREGDHPLRSQARQSLAGQGGKSPGHRLRSRSLARSLTEHTPWTAEVEGTAPYMAPEQAARTWGPIDVRTDVYGVGAVLHALLTGRPPWVGRRLPDILADVSSAAPVIPPTSLRPDLPESLSHLCRKCLSKSPEGRYPSVQEVRWALTESSADLSRCGSPSSLADRRSEPIGPTTSGDR